MNITKEHGQALFHLDMILGMTVGGLLRAGRTEESIREGVDSTINRLKEMMVAEEAGDSAAMDRIAKEAMDSIRVDVNILREDLRPDHNEMPPSPPRRD